MAATTGAFTLPMSMTSASAGTASAMAAASGARLRTGPAYTELKSLVLERNQVKDLGPLVSMSKAWTENASIARISPFRTSNWAPATPCYRPRRF